MKSAPLAYTLAFGFLWRATPPSRRNSPVSTFRRVAGLPRRCPQKIAIRFQGCIQDETSAESQLRRHLGREASAAHRGKPARRRAQLVGSPSYVDMLVCLQMYQGAASTAPQQRRPAAVRPRRA